MSGIMLNLLGNTSGGGAVFDDYGVYSDTISSVASVFDYGDESLGDYQSSFNSVLLDGTGSGESPLNARLFTSSNDDIGNKVKPVYLYPASGYNWSTVSQSSHIYKDDTTDAVTNSSQMNYGSMYGGSHYTDSTSTKVLCRAAQYGSMTNSDYSIYTHYVYKNSSNTYTKASYQTPIASSGSGSTRFQHDLHSTENTLVQAGKDQSGAYFGTSGQATYMHINQLTNSGGIGSYFETAKLVQNDAQNTHGQTYRGAFLGGRVDGSTMYAYYIGLYYNYGGGANGYKLVRINQPTSNNSAMGMTVTGHQNFTVGTTGLIFHGSQVWPHAFVSIYSGSTYNASQSADTYYLDLSETWSSSYGVNFQTVVSGDTMKFISRVGGTTSAPVFAMLQSGELRIKSFNPSTLAFSQIATASIGNPGRVNGIWPIPNTNRIIVSKQEGLHLFEVS